MSENWQAGDLALCVKSAGTLHGATSGELQGGPIMGCIYPVRDVKDFPEYHHLETTIGLKIDGFIGWVSAVYFRKLDQHTPDEQDAETVALLTGVPAKAHADA